MIDQNLYEEILFTIEFEKWCESRELRKKHSRNYSFNEAIFDFKDDLYYVCKIKQQYEPEAKWNMILEKIQKESVNLEAARGKRLDSVLDMLGIKHNRGRCACPLCDSSNETTMSFNGNVFYCFKCGAKGDSISFVQQYKKIGFVQAVKFLI